MATDLKTFAAKILSYGGGLDSFTMLLKAIKRGELPDACVFMDVADPEHLDPGEWPSTYRHIEEVVKPLCAQHGIPFVTISSDRYPVRGARSLFAYFQGEGVSKKRKQKHGIQIPVANGPNRVCTRAAKVERFEQWLDDNYPGQDVEVWIGFEAGEEKRVVKDPNAGKAHELLPGQARRHNRFPLMEDGLCRCRCEQVVRASGYPVPRKSACTFCPMASRGDWKTLASELPATFQRIVELEASKPVTKKGIKLSIMGFRTIKNPDGSKRHVAPALPVFISKPYKAKKQSCGVCGAPRASKATGCSYLEDSCQEAA